MYIVNNEIVYNHHAEMYHQEVQTNISIAPREPRIHVDQVLYEHLILQGGRVVEPTVRAAQVRGGCGTATRNRATQVVEQSASSAQIQDSGEGEPVDGLAQGVRVGAQGACSVQVGKEAAAVTNPAQGEKG